MLSAKVKSKVKASEGQHAILRPGKLHFGICIVLNRHGMRVHSTAFDDMPRFVVVGAITRRVISGIARSAAVGIGARVLLAPAELEVKAVIRASFPILSTTSLQHTPLSHSWAKTGWDR
jgi:hypothetical protein